MSNSAGLLSEILSLLLILYDDAAHQSYDGSDKLAAFKCYLGVFARAEANELQPRAVPPLLRQGSLENIRPTTMLGSN